MSDLRRRDRRPNPHAPTGPTPQADPGAPQTLQEATPLTPPRIINVREVTPNRVGDGLFLTLLREDGRKVSILLDPDDHPNLLLQLLQVLQGQDRQLAASILAHFQVEKTGAAST